MKVSAGNAKQYASGSLVPVIEVFEGEDDYNAATFFFVYSAIHLFLTYTEKRAAHLTMSCIFWIWITALAFFSPQALCM